MSGSPKVAISDVRPNPVALRQVNRESEDFQSLRDSIADVGVMSPISVREKQDENGVTYYELIDGLHRYTATLEAGLTEIPVNVLVLSDQKVLAAQIQANSHTIETRPVEFTQQMQRMFTLDPSLTVSDMAALVKKTPAWVEQRLGLLKLNEGLKDLVDSGQIKLGNAYVIGKLPVDEQLNYAEAAIVEDANTFAAGVEARVKQLREASRQGRDAKPAEFVPQIHLRKMADLKAEVYNPQVAAGVLEANKVTDPVAAFNLGIKWALSLDEGSIASARAKYEEKKAALEEAKKKANAERSQKKLEEAARATLAARVEAGIATDEEAAQHAKNVEEAKAARAAAKAKKEAEAAAAQTEAVTA